MAKRYRKKPVELVANYLSKGRQVALQGRIQTSQGDYIIKGVKGEFYPCKPDIFNMTYEEID